MGLRPNLP